MWNEPFDSMESKKQIYCCFASCGVVHVSTGLNVWTAMDLKQQIWQLIMAGSHVPNAIRFPTQLGLRPVIMNLELFRT